MFLLDEIANFGAPESEDSRLIAHVITFEVTQPNPCDYVLKHCRRTDGGRTDGLH